MRDNIGILVRNVEVLARIRLDIEKQRDIVSCTLGIWQIRRLRNEMRFVGTLADGIDLPLPVEENWTSIRCRRITSLQRR